LYHSGVSSETPDPGPVEPPSHLEAPVVVAATQGGALEIHPPHAPIHTFKDFVIQLVTITAGVLIALSFEGVREWNHYRTLVAEARENIAREIADNRREVQIVLNGMDQRRKNLKVALQMANEVLTTKKTSVNQISLGFELADMTSSSWLTAERTGALAHMDYAEVQKYSRLYSLQDLYVDRQRRGVEQLAAVMGILTGDPTRAPIKDLELFRERVIEQIAGLTLEEGIAKRLLEAYDQVAKQ
jgi:hypothetical protein